jgi:DNA-binding NtrC family response regulator
MAYRLLIQLDDSTVRSDLRVGETLIGSSAEADVQIPHYTVSRKHAVIRVKSNRCELEDLDSKNGTTVRGDRIHDVTPVKPGMKISFGGVSAVVEEVDDSDTEIAVTTSSTPPRRTTAFDGDDTDPTTLSLGSLKAITLGRMPMLLQDIAGGATLAETARSVASILFDQLPCRLLEVIDNRGRSPSFLFSAGDRGIAADQGLLVPTAAAGIDLRIVLIHAAHERAWEPLVRSLALLIGLGASDTPIVRQDRSAEVTTCQPHPPSVVAAVKRIYEDAGRVAASDISVMIHGESGTGKEVLARSIHAASGRDPEKFVPLNCAALPRDLLEAELFGIEKGVATGVEPRAGKFELADNGTIFLDEIGDMAPSTQAKILRVIQEREVFRLGAATPRPTRVRVISATNKDIETLVSTGTFRADLFHRIADWVVELPPLRMRRDDIPTLAGYFLERACRERSVFTPGITRAALDALSRYSWPGNIRQLEREMARAALFLEDGEALDSSRLKPEIVQARAGSDDRTLESIVRNAELRAIHDAIESCGGDAAAAAKRLGVPRSTFYRKLKALGIERER